MNAGSGNVFAVQMDIAWHDKEANFSRARRLLDRVPPPPGSLVVLSELFATGFTMNVIGMAEEAGGPTAQFLAEVARERSVFCIGGMIERSPSGRGRNVSLLFGPDGGLLGRYVKIQPFTPGDERDHYDAGDEVVIWDWNGLRVAPFICYDLRFPELFRHAMIAGAEAFVVIASWPKARASHWVSLLQARAIENQAYVIGVNRSGSDPQFEFPGRSLIVDPGGTVLADAGPVESIVSATVDREEVVKLRRRLPFLEDLLPGFLGLAEGGCRATD